MAARRLADYASALDPIFKLPHPYLTAYYVVNGDGPGTYQLNPRAQDSGTALPKDLQGGPVIFTEPEGLKSSDRPDESNNTPWGRARRSPLVTIHWTQERPPALAQLWLAIYAVFTSSPNEEYFRVQIFGFGADALSRDLKGVSLAIDHPKPSKESQEKSNELLVLRGAFWQGAGSPFGARPVWVPEEQHAGQQRPLSSYPLASPDYTMTNDADTALCWHPRRAVKPRPGSVIYSRYIPHLKETFSMIALDYRNKEHLGLFHQWQNDPRVSQGWNETGTLEQHREYLRKADEDPHQITILARFEDICFAYFEVYWAKACSSHISVLDFP